MEALPAPRLTAAAVPRPVQPPGGVRVNAHEYTDKTLPGQQPPAAAAEQRRQEFPNTAAPRANNN